MCVVRGLPRTLRPVGQDSSQVRMEEGKKIKDVETTVTTLEMLGFTGKGENEWSRPGDLEPRKGLRRSFRTGWSAGGPLQREGEGGRGQGHQKSVFKGQEQHWMQRTRGRCGAGWDRGRVSIVTQGQVTHTPHDAHCQHTPTHSPVAGTSPCASATSSRSGTCGGPGSGPGAVAAWLPAAPQVTDCSYLRPA